MEPKTTVADVRQGLDKTIGYQLQVRTRDNPEWRPAIAGTLNQTGRSDGWASTFATRAQADAAVDTPPVDTYLGSYYVVEWRIVEVDARAEVPELARR